MSRGDSMNRRDFFVQTIALGVGLTPTGKSSARGNASPANISSTDSRGNYETQSYCDCHRQKTVPRPAEAVLCKQQRRILPLLQLGRHFCFRT